MRGTTGGDGCSCVAAEMGRRIPEQGDGGSWSSLQFATRHCHSWCYISTHIPFYGLELRSKTVLVWQRHVCMNKPHALPVFFCASRAPGLIAVVRTSRCSNQEWSRSQDHLWRASVSSHQLRGIFTRSCLCGGLDGEESSYCCFALCLGQLEWRSSLIQIDLFLDFMKHRYPLVNGSK